MTKAFSPDDLLRYLYQETSDKESRRIALKLATDRRLWEEFENLRNTMSELNQQNVAPPAPSVAKILAYSRSFKPDSEGL
ncbi:MAG: hypothetical protein HC913_20215 [Microscillaceae bacterium]|nr:hypothetical protein [Microscillaceae bacterium]